MKRLTPLIVITILPISLAFSSAKASLLWDAPINLDGSAEWYGLFTVNFENMPVVDFSSGGVRFEDNGSASVAAYEIDLSSASGQLQAEYDIVGTSLDDSGVFFFWEDSSGDFFDITSKELGSFGAYSALELSFRPYSSPALDISSSFTLSGTEVLPLDAVKLHLRILILGVNGGDVLEISRIGATLVDTGTPSAIPLPPAVWLFCTALIGLVGFSKRRKAA